MLLTPGAGTEERGQGGDEGDADGEEGGERVHPEEIGRPPRRRFPVEDEVDQAEGGPERHEGERGVDGARDKAARREHEGEQPRHKRRKEQGEEGRARGRHSRSRLSCSTSMLSKVSWI